MKNIAPYLAIILVIASTLGVSYLHGRNFNRWGITGQTIKVAQRFEKLPKKYGNWRLVTENPLDEQVQKILKTAAYINGTFLNEATGEQVNAFVILGPVGPIAVHTPEICYSSQNYSQDKPRSMVQIPKPDGKELSEDKFWALTMRSRDVHQDLLRVYYAWTNGEHWAASKNPRYEFGLSEYLLKMQLAAYLPPDTDLQEHDSCRNFLQEVLPILREQLLTESAQTKAADPSGIDPQTTPATEVPETGVPNTEAPTTEPQQKSA